MRDKERVNRHKVLRKILVFIPLIFLFSLGVHYRPSSSFDYSEVKAFDEKDGFIRTDFGFLSGFDSEKEKAPNQVKALNGKKVAITGFMLPVDFDRGVVRSFLLLKDQTGCCFGVMPRINEFVYVKMQGGDSAEFMTDVPITVSGGFGVDEKTWSAVCTL